MMLTVVIKVLFKNVINVLTPKTIAMFWYYIAVQTSTIQIQNLTYEHSKIINLLIVNSYLPHRHYEGHELLSSFLLLEIKITLNCVNMIFSQINLVEYIFICLLYLQLHEVKTWKVIGRITTRIIFSGDLWVKELRVHNYKGGPGAFPRELRGVGGSKTGPSPENVKNFDFKLAFLNHFAT